ncbi:MAG TPA: tRNA (adenosine(37)-N6)-threonylcarbamoyltransferase complex dimerization subunit type 1 TsaB [Steroidobacteraceae bacterium]
MKILALDAATELCSAALWIDGVSATREAARPQGAGELLLGLVAQLLAESGLGLNRLDALAFGRGPGAFTGVRLAVGVAQGLGFAAGIPLLPVSDLRALAHRVLACEGASMRALVCQDARMAQVYWACFERRGEAPVASAEPVSVEAVSAPAAVRLPAAWDGTAVCAAGSGFEVHATLADMPALQGARVWGHLRPRAVEIAQLAAVDGLGRAVPADMAQPVYVRDEVAAPPS